ncbi:hypothetical protein IZU89_05170 [Cellulophaga lytica]|uniref:Rieske (2Fe-2S) protein n=1 Tax=Cellulophaga TaxID=104264 RepID=UPI0009509135|nr:MULTISPECIES: hypothetical protein [Cellulophaga]APU09744.1 hypothetical protein A5M85_05445 [Cellulophaga lytica]MDO6855009.1 hypothetical protein [Cellulophaga lytica]TVZ08599.1 hypothetical protein JM80_1096 [Cellulophaga sp. RHA_52]SNQ43568.1 Hypothetical lipoprotein [Cellulophaga lytica]
MKTLFTLLAVFLLLSCDSGRTNRNPYLQEISFRIDLNLNLPSYSALKNTGNAVYVGSQGVGTKGIFVINTGFDSFMAFEASCPNHEPSSCSTMVLDDDKQNVTCPCEDYKYNLFTGQFLNRPDDDNRYHDMLFYSSSINGNIVTVRN